MGLSEPPLCNGKRGVTYGPHEAVDGTPCRVSPPPLSVASGDCGVWVMTHVSARLRGSGHGFDPQLNP
eukprot:5200513-Prymnesium_polylepis.1